MGTFILGLVCWLLLWLAWRVVRWMLGPFLRWYARPRQRRQYVLPAHWNWTLALADPMAFAQIQGGFADARMPSLRSELQNSLRPALLHQLGLRADMIDAQIQDALPRRLRAHWFRLDLDTLHEDDDARDALALACARVAFAVRTAALLGWIDADTQWELLHHNALRASECFDSWSDYGHALARGRQQWIAKGRADSLGCAFTPADVNAWLANRDHPWHWLPWPLPTPPERPQR